MIDTTINDDKTIAGDGEGAILVGRYRVPRRLGPSLVGLRSERYGIIRP